MRTTVDMTPEHRSALLAIAARRGEKGFLGVLNDAIELYLSGEDDRRRRREEILNLAGSLSAEEAAELRDRTEAVRRKWR